jgi:hypothetical protein
MKPNLFDYNQPGVALPEADSAVILRGLSSAEWDVA